MSEGRRALNGRYVIEKMIDEGGMSYVYKGQDLKLDRTVAIKILKPEFANDESISDKFRKEAKSASLISHKAIVKVFDAGEDFVQPPGKEEISLPFIVMEYVDGSTLKSLMKSGIFGPYEAIAIIQQVLEALGHSHSVGIIHRDIKPANIMVLPSGQVKVMDFGIARAISDSSISLTESTSILGTAAYFSPEQARGESVDARSDLYSTGVVLFQMLSGELPFKGESPVIMAYQHVSAPIPNVRDLSPTLPKNYDSLFKKALAKNRNGRFQSSEEFIESLRDVKDGKEVKVPELPDTLFENFSFKHTEGYGFQKANYIGGEVSNSIKPPKKPPFAVIWTLSVSVLVLFTVLFVSLFWISPSVNLTTQNVDVPDVSNMELGEALLVLDDAGIKYEQLSEANDEVDGGLVIRTSPKAGVIITPETEVQVYVSSGSASVMVPDLSGLYLDEAEKLLVMNDLKLGTVTKIDDPDAPLNMVLFSSPTANLEMPPGTRVNLQVSNGRVTVPDVTGRSLSTGTVSLQTLGLAVEAEPNTACAAAEGYPIISQNLIGAHPQHSTVKLSYCTG